MSEEIFEYFITPHFTTPIKVKMSGRHIGDIKQAIGGYQYFPKGQKIGGEIYPTIKEVKQSLEMEC